MPPGQRLGCLGCWTLRQSRAGLPARFLPGSCPRTLVAATWPRPRRVPSLRLCWVESTTSADQLRKQVRSALQATLSQDQVGRVRFPASWACSEDPPVPPQAPSTAPAAEEPQSWAWAWLGRLLPLQPQQSLALIQVKGLGHRKGGRVPAELLRVSGAPSRVCPRQDGCPACNGERDTPGGSSHPPTPP